MATQGEDEDVEPGHQGRVKDPEHDGPLKENRGAGVTKGTTPASTARAAGHPQEGAKDKGK